MWLVIATLLFHMWEKGLKEEQKDMREVGEKKNEKRGQEKEDCKEINMRARGREAGIGRRENKRELKLI